MTELIQQVDRLKISDVSNSVGRFSLSNVAKIGFGSIAIYQIAKRLGINQAICYHVKKQLQYVRDLWIHRTKYAGDYDLMQLRSAFRDTVYPRIAVHETTDQTHTHPYCGAHRSAATVFARALANSVGLNVHVHQASSADVRDNLNHDRSYYWAKDLIVAPSNTQPDVRSLIVLVDVDFYIALNTFLVFLPLTPVLLYTFQPKASAWCEGEFSYWFDKYSTVHYKVSGGAVYEHPVWDFGKDVLGIEAWGITRHYLVERRQANEHHELVLLIPIAEWHFPNNYLSCMMTHDELDVSKFVQDDFVVMDLQTRNGVQRSIAKLGTTYSITLPLKDVEAALSACRQCKVSFGAASAQRWTGDDEHASFLLAEYANAKIVERPKVVFPPAKGLVAYQIMAKLPEYDAEAKPLVQAYMCPLYPQVYVPTKTQSNEIAAYFGRVVRPQVKAAQELCVTRTLMNSVEAFCRSLPCAKHSLYPVSVDEVYLRQSRPTQRHILMKAEVEKRDGVKVETFMKSEPYTKISDPRVITTYDGVFKRDYSKYLYAYSDMLMETNWYAFGKTPRVIADRVSTIAMRAKKIACADAKRHDGHISVLARFIEKFVLLWVFHPSCHKEISGLHESQYGNRVRTQLRLNLKQFFERGSGSPETAVFNSTDTEIIIGTGRILEGMSPDEAYSTQATMCDLAGGDDSLTAVTSELSAGYLEKAASMFGQEWVIDLFNRGDPGVNFLARIFTPDVWYGEPASMCDLPRALGKLHVTVSLTGVTPLQKLQAKLSGLFRTDSDTPIVREMCCAAIRVGIDLYAPIRHELESWWAGYDIDENWPQKYDFSPFYDIILKDTDPRQLLDYLSRVTTPLELLTCPAIAELPKPVAQPEQGVVVASGEVIQNKPLDLPTELAKAKTEIPCKKFLLGTCKGKCEFKHIKVCRDFLKGTCKRTKCNFEHLRL